MTTQSRKSNLQKLTILDGGMGSELIRRGATPRDGLWSAGALLDCPETVVDIHADYIRAGAEVITTNSYSTIPSYLEKHGLETRYEELARLAGSLAKTAVRRSNKAVQIAGSIPPLDESYRPDLIRSPDECRPVYINLVKALLPNIDCFLCETMTSIQEASVAIEAVKSALGGRQIPILVSLSLKEAPSGLLRSGESVENAAQVLEPLGISGLLFNCTSPEAIENATSRVNGSVSVPVGGYPNRFVEVPADWTLDNEVQIKRDKSLTADSFVEGALRCVAKGAEMYGGCCGTTPKFIEALALQKQTTAVAPAPSN